VGLEYTSYSTIILGMWIIPWRYTQWYYEISYVPPTCQLWDVFHKNISYTYLRTKLEDCLMWWVLSWLLREFSDANLRSFCQHFNWMLQLSSGMFQLNSSGPDDDWSIQWNIDPDGYWNIELKHQQKSFSDLKLVLENSLFYLEDCLCLYHIISAAKWIEIYV